MTSKFVLCSLLGLFISYAAFSEQTPLAAWLDQVDLADSITIQNKLQETIKEKDARQLGQIYLDWGWFMQERKFDQDSARIFYTNAEQIFTSIGDKRGIANASLGLSDLYMEMDRSADAIQKGHEAYALFKELGDTLQSYWALSSVAISHDYVGDHDVAVAYYHDCITICKALGRKGGEASMLKNIGGIYSDEGEYKLALEYYERSLKIADSLNLIGLMSSCHQGFFLTYINMELSSEALFHLKEQMRLAVLSDDLREMGFAHQDHAGYYLHQEQYELALDHAQKTLDIGKRLGNVQLITNGTERLRKAYAGLGEFEKAYNYYTEEVAMNDSLFNVSNAEIIQSIREQFESEKRERELAEKSLALQTADIQLGQQRNVQLLLYIAMSLLCAIILTIYLVLRNRSKTTRLLAEKNEQIEARNRQIEQINETRTRWFMNVAHELRTPLTLIKGPVQKTLSEGDLQSDVTDRLKMVARNADNLIALVNEILDLSKLEEGKMPTHFRPVDFNDLLYSVINVFEGKANDLGIELIHKGVSPLYLNVDPDKLAKVIFNLVSNALRYTPAGGRVKVETTLNVEGVCITVSDSGAGIPEEDLPYVFDRFYQASNSDNTGGTGLGLALSKEIVELHAGKLKVASVVGEGSIFSILLPPESVSTEAAYLDFASTVTDNDQRSILSDVLSRLTEKPTILIVEDNEDMRLYLQSLLESHFRVRKASNGYEGLQVLRGHSVDMIISDLMMPMMDGYEFAKKVKEHREWRYIPFIHLSAISEAEGKKRALMIGVDDYLQKPFDAEELIIRVENLYRNSLVRKEVVDNDREEVSFDEKLLKKLKDEVLEYVSDFNFNVLRLADCAAMSERQIYRYIKSTTGLTPLQFIQEIKLNKAMELLQKRVYVSSSELAAAVGFQRPPYFSSLFEKRFGKKPSSYMKVG